MMIKIFNWVIGSFFRTLGRLVAPTVLLLIGVLIGGCDVQALETTYKPGYTVPLAIRQASLTSPTEFNKSAYGNIITDDAIMPAYIYALYNGGGYTYETYGTFITFCPNEGFISNHTYTLRFIVSTAPGSYANNQYFRYGTAWNQPIKLVNSIGINPITSGVYVKNLTTNNIQYTDVLSQDFSYITEMTATFTAPSQNTCVSINIDMNGNFNNQIMYFLGYILIDSGVDNSQQLDDIKDSVNDVDDSINNPNVDNNNVSNTLNNVSLGDEGVITQLITLPINLFTNILNSINGECNSFNLGNLFGTNLTLPCINIENIIGSNLWSIIDLLFSGFSIYFIANKIKRIFEHITNLREGDILND